MKSGRKHEFPEASIREVLLNARHLVISDLHERWESLHSLIRTARKMPGKFDDIWLLGDVFGHSSESTGVDMLTQLCLDKLRILLDYPCLTVSGNWEDWLNHPELDNVNQHQEKYQEQLQQRRQLLEKRQNRDLRKLLFGKSIQVFPAKGEGQFTLFHGCSYACYNNSDYQPIASECYLYPRSLNIVTRGLFGNTEHLQTRHFLFGHTHTPGWFVYSESSKLCMWQYFTPEIANRPLAYEDGCRRFGINPGSASVSGKKMPLTALLLDTNEKTFTYLMDEGW